MNTLRKIIFKAKRISDGQWFEGNYSYREWVYGVKKDLHYINGETDALHCYQYEIDPTTLSQFTGLYDKDGNKIWENDIVKFDVYEYEKLISSVISDIKWCKELCSLSVVVNKQGTRGTLGHFLDLNKEVKIVGNIFDNPELLEENLNEQYKQTFT